MAVRKPLSQRGNEVKRFKCTMAIELGQLMSGDKYYGSTCLSFNYFDRAGVSMFNEVLEKFLLNHVYKLLSHMGMAISRFGAAFNREELVTLLKLNGNLQRKDVEQYCSNMLYFLGIVYW
ncbi:hypothetical protein Trydic_g22466 [Trypoxylus dichotomus]